MQEDWKTLKSFLPQNWEVLASETGALKGLRKHKSADNFLRVLLIHIGCGYSLRETAVRASETNLGEFSDVALLKRLKKSKNWLYKMCLSLFEERGIKLTQRTDFKMRIFDATHVKEPGKTGSLWRIHYSMVLPFLSCDYFKLTPVEGRGNGEKLLQFPIAKGDYILADRGYSHADGINYIVSQKAYITVRVNSGGLKILDLEGKAFPLLQKVRSIKNAGNIKSWDVLVSGTDNKQTLGRLCVIRKTQVAIDQAHRKLKKISDKKGSVLKEETLEFNKYIIVFSNFPTADFSATDVLEWYRMRWQIELVFKRFKSLAQLGHLPKYDDESAKAWLYGKLFIALLIEKLIGCANDISPWGYLMGKPKTAESMA